MTTEGERLAAVETSLSGLREDVGELRTELERSRGRLHNAEGLLGALVEQEKLRRQATGERQRSLEIRIQWLMFVVAAAALAEPFLYHLAGGG